MAGACRLPAQQIFMNEIEQFSVVYRYAPATRGLLSKRFLNFFYYNAFIQKNMIQSWITRAGDDVAVDC